MNQQHSRGIAAFLAAAIAPFAAPALGEAQTNNFIIEQSINAVPLDLELTPNGAVAIVRSNSSTSGTLSDPNRVTFWKTNDSNASTVRILPSGSLPFGRGNVPFHTANNKPMFSDAIAATNDRVVAVGSADTGGAANEDTTYVDIFALTYPSGTPQVQVIASHALGGEAGEVNDVAITPDGALAVVISKNWIHVFELVTGTKVTEFNVGATGAKSPLFARNSIALTNTRAVVGMSSDVVGVDRKPWVYILDLTVDPPLLKLAYMQGNPNETTNQSVHDLAITPNGRQAVVASSGSVALYDLASSSVVGSPFWDSVDGRNWNYFVAPDPVADLWHSVEVSNTHAVVLANRLVNQVEVWGVRVFPISGGFGSPVSYEGSSSLSGDTAWDLAMPADGAVASIKTRSHDLALLDVPNATSSNLFKAGLLGGAGFPSTSAGDTSVLGLNDATVVLEPTGSDPNAPRWAVFMGQSAANVVRLRFYNLSASSWADPGPSVCTFALSESGTGASAMPADLELAPNGNDVMTRLTAAIGDSGAQDGVDWSRWHCNTPSEIPHSFGGKGVCRAADNLRTRRGAFVSISTDPSPSTSAGWIHIVAIQ